MEEQPEFYTKENGDKIWYLPSKGKDYWHRLDGPAVEYANGTKHWWVDNKRHRLDGPAIEYAYGTKYWWIDDKLHRLDGPAIEWSDGSNEWYVDGQNFDTEEVECWLKENKIDLTTKEGQMAFKLRFG